MDSKHKEIIYKVFAMAESSEHSSIDLIAMLSNYSHKINLREKLLPKYLTCFLA